MSASPFIADVAQADFATRVVEASHRQPVLVDFWAPWCGPCRILMPVLAKLAEKYGGKFLLAKVNTDSEQQLAAEYHIRGIPAVKLFRNGKVVDEFTGVQPEPAIRALLDRHIPRAADAAIARAAELANDGKTSEAIALLRRAVAEDANYDRAKIELARQLLSETTGTDLASHLSEAQRLLGGLSLRAGADPHVEALKARLGLLQALIDAPPVETLEHAVADDAENHAARYRLAAHLALTNRYEAALEHFLELVRRARAYGDDAGRRGLLATFQLLGSRDPLVIKYRGLLARTLN